MKMTAFNKNAKTEAGTVLMATYGSLRRGMGNIWCNDAAKATFVATGTAVEPCQLYSYGSGSFPSVSLNPAHVQPEMKDLVVDIYSTDEKGLTGPYDGLEGYPTFYNRTEMPFKLTQDAVIDGEELKAGTVVTAWIYHIDEVQCNAVNSGDWCTHKVGEDYYEKLESLKDSEELDDY